jgi:hypothetical protein
VVEFYVNMSFQVSYVCVYGFEKEASDPRPHFRMSRTHSKVRIFG